MAFDPKTVFGLCNVLNRHAKQINLKTSLEQSSQHQIEQWAKRMDLTYRDSARNWHYILSEPLKVVNNLKMIENLSSALVTELYAVEPGIQKQLSKGLCQDGYVKFRQMIREQLDQLKDSINNVKLFFDDGLNLIILPESIAAVDAVIDVWRSSEKNMQVPETIKNNVALKNFTDDCFEIFNVDSDTEISYRHWYELNQ